MGRTRQGVWLGLALLVALALWPLFKYQVGPLSELRLRIESVGWPLEGSVTYQRQGHGPQASRLSKDDLTLYDGHGLPEGVQELRIPLPRRTVAVEVALEKLSGRTVSQARWVARAPVLWGDPGGALAFEQHTDEDGTVHVRIPETRPGFWTPDVADVVMVLGTWWVLWLALEARWGTGRAAAFARRRAGWAKCALPLALAWGGLWLLYFPGLIGFDPLLQWEQVVARQFVNWHPPFHTWWLWLIAGPFDSMASVSALQVLMFAGLLGKLLEELGHWKVPGWARWAVVAWAALSPALGTNVIAVWKDAPFTWMCLWAGLVILRAERTGGLTVKAAARLGLCVACISLLRHNGPLVALPLMVSALWRYPGSRQRGTLAILGVGLTLLVRGPVYVAANVKPSPPLLTQVLSLHRLGTAAFHADTLPPDDVKTLTSLMPLEDWKRRYRCESVGFLIWPGSPLYEHPELLEGRALEMAGVVGRFARSHPDAFFDQWVCVTRYLWALDSMLYIGPFQPDGGAVDKNVFGWRTRSWFPALARPYTQVLLKASIGEPWQRILMWQPAPSLYLLLAALCGVLWRQRSPGALLALQCALTNTAAWLVLSPNPDLRFQFAAMLSAPLALALLLAPRLARTAAREAPGPRVTADVVPARDRDTAA
ncbi:hypothetical protein [Corallococcus sp. Z5C101001]|uniref:hypothetical protein n=1 Tax=Corallococcus sp. Z5C101001 TaxID=2596829 RepID=UPI00117D410B|nr:hypothetical protein [Corallococcus sp. Z5C101001]TSC25038.1 hypothetical protein FOF48_24165 [Corallococcus sp. Z5C101001]